MFRKLFLLFTFCPLMLIAQETKKYTSDHVDFYRAEDLYEKAQFSAARKEFRAFIERNKNEIEQSICRI